MSDYFLGVFCFPRGTMVLVLLLSFLHTTSPGDRTSGYLVHISSEESVSVLKLKAQRFGLRYVEQISPHVHIFKENDNSTIPTNFQDFQEFFKEKILDVQAIRSRKMKQFRYNFVSKQTKLEHFLEKRSVRVCDPYFGMDVEKAWSLNYTGAGVNVAVLDVGIDTHHPDLRQNVREELGYNFVDSNRRHEYAPEYDEDYYEADVLMDHGNNIAGLIVAVKGNDLCCRGVAYNASVVPLVVFKLKHAINWKNPEFDDTHISRALVHKNKQIQIYSNSYNNELPFVEPSIAVKDALLTGVNKGRGGKGSVFVFTLGDNNKNITDGNTDFYANNIYSITVGSVGKDGIVPKYAIPCSCIIASTLGDGKTLFYNNFLTTSHRGRCTSIFRGNSASAGIMAAVVALGLNDRLSWRDVQHILILTSSLDMLKPTLPSYVNDVGLMYNPHFGYGLVNATAFATLASTWDPVPKEVTFVHHMTSNLRLIPKQNCRLPKMHYVNVKVIENSSAIFIEHVMADIQYTASNESFVTIKLFSPAGTCSVLLHDSPGVRNQEPVSRKWNFTSVQFWGESPYGNWTLLMTQFDRATNKSYTNFSVKDVNLHIYGIRKGKRFRHKLKKTHSHQNNTEADSEEAKLLDSVRDTEKRNNCFTVETGGAMSSTVKALALSVLLVIVWISAHVCV